ncbi:MAG: methyl-accepting chemotaxis protein [Lachnospiraceae bacterium]
MESEKSTKVTKKKGMKSIRKKIIVGILLCSTLTALLTGILSAGNSTMMISSDAKEKMRILSEVEATKLNATILRIEQSVHALSKVVMQDFDFDSFKKSKSYADEYTAQIQELAGKLAEGTEGGVTFYVRYNPKYSNPTSGIFASRNSDDEAFAFLTPTDFSMYEEGDVEHVGWYYIPVQNGAAMWMEPYLNANINVYMISYVIPLYAADGTNIGIVGMDIDFTTITDMVDAATVYETGYAFLVNEDGAIMHHKGLSYGTKLSNMGSGLAQVSAVFGNAAKQGESITYSYEGKDKNLVYYNLENGMRFVLTALKSEIYARSNRLISIIVCVVLLAWIVSGAVGVFVGNSIAKPIKKLTGIIAQTVSLDFTPTQDGNELRQHRDEIGEMATAVHQMRNVLRKMIADMTRVENTVLGSIENLDDIMRENNVRAEENSAATQQIAAGMQEASANTEHIVGSIEEVKRNSEQIYALAQNGEKNSRQILNRAGEMEKVTKDSSEKTNDMYAVMKQKTESAIEKSKAVQRINELTDDIKSISSQTNLLALNANIEAARAGDAGRGFAVVASEIGSLASQTLQTVDNINVIVGEVNEAVAGMAECITAMMEFLEKTVLDDYGTFRESGGQYRRDADSFIEVMGQIKGAIENLDSYMAQIVSAVDDINHTVGSSAQDINEIADKTEQTKTTTADGYERLQKSRESVKALHEIIGQFRL